MTPILDRIRKAVPMTVFAIAYLSMLAILVLT
ncbi:hypothetical protein ABIE58_004099 [Roseovarius sp. MBR-78]|jgi:hypothetical protein